MRRFFITNWGRFITKGDLLLLNATILIRNVTIITKGVSTLIYLHFSVVISLLVGSLLIVLSSLLYP